ncbi:MAG: HDIG domain-containing protein [Deltaproteobacteria bacterium]|nr:HDIG domain-containing protein [Deltaproteobacteria bacterium]
MGVKLDSKIRRFIPNFPGGQRKGAPQARNKDKKDKKVKVNPLLLRLCLLLALALLPALLALPGSYPQEIRVKLGDVAKRDIKADRDLMILDQAATSAKRKAASQNALPVFDLDDQVTSRVRKQIHDVFVKGRALYQPSLPDRPDMPASVSIKPYKETEAQFQQEFNSLFGLEPGDKAFRVMVGLKFSSQTENAISFLITDALARGIVTNEDLRAVDTSRGVIIRHLFAKREQTRSDVNSFMNPRRAQRMVMAQALLYRDDFEPGQIKVMVSMARNMLKPDMSLNREEIEKRRLEAVRSVTPVFFQLKRGEMIVREGERIGLMAKLKLQGLAHPNGELEGIFRAAGIFLLTLIFISVLYACSQTRLVKARLADKDIMFLSILLALGLLVIALASMTGRVMAGEWAGLTENTLLYVTPLAAGAMVAAIFLGPTPAILFAIVNSTLAGLMLGSFTLSFYFLIGAVVGLAGVCRVHERGVIIRSGLYVGLINISVLFGLGLYNESLLTVATFFDLGAGFINGILAGIIVTGLVPIFEMIFKYTTDIKLMELANLDRPILRELMVQAPGTYHHSVIVGAMVEAAAEAIQANPLLAKVSAYYHDIGKLNKPSYFVENQGGNANKHEKITPSMSSLILVSHVKDGVDLAKKNKLSPDIIEIIRQHHGTSLITYFFEKAKEGQNGDQSKIDSENYRYPGPKPQTKEAGLVLLADSVEAASRTLHDPTPARIQGMVQKIINAIFSNGQLDECELTLKDLHLIAASFNKVLSGIFHRRIEYPESAAKEAASEQRTAN